MGVLLWSRWLGETLPLEVGGITEERGVGWGRCDVVVGHGGGKLRRRLRGVLPNHSHGGSTAMEILERRQRIGQFGGVMFKGSRVGLV
jgi:hypothetical protein